MLGILVAFELLERCSGISKYGMNLMFCFISHYIVNVTLCASSKVTRKSGGELVFKMGKDDCIHR